MPRKFVGLTSKRRIFRCSATVSPADLHDETKLIHTASERCSVCGQFDHRKVLVVMAHPQPEVVREWPGRAQTFGR